MEPIRVSRHDPILAGYLFDALALWLFAKNFSTARRTSADTGASDFSDIVASCFACESVSHTTVLFMPR